MSETNRLTEISSVLYPTDFSNASLEIGKEVVHFCQKFKATLHLLHVLETDAVVSMYGHSLDSARDIEDGVKETLDQRLTEFSTALQAPEDVPITTALRTGTMAETICGYAASKDVSLIVMATHGRSGISHLFLGSVTERVVRISGVPVLTMKD